MSLILLGLSTLEENNGQVPICNLPIRNATCGGNFSCHFKPNVDDILVNLGLSANEGVKDSFAMPQKWFCSEFTLFSLWHLKEKEKQENAEETGLEMFFERQNDTAGQKNKTNKLVHSLDINVIEEDLSEKKSIKEMFEYLEHYDFRCYYSLTKPYVVDDSEPQGFEMLICYQENNDNLEPNQDIKVLFDIVYYLDGSVDIIDWIISKNEEQTYEKIMDFNK